MNILIVIAAFVFSLNTYAFNYIEHSVLTDKSCYEAQIVLGEQISKGNKKLTSKYLALSLYCPTKWDKPYCKDDYKQVFAQVNASTPESNKNGDYSVTLGDISAIADHTKHFGSINGYPRAKEEGLLSSIIEWVNDDDSEADGYLEDVAEDSCETGDTVNWPQLHKDLQASLNMKFHLKPEQLLPSQRAPLKKGPSDPSGLYSFDNPQYLDFVLKNHHHFGKQSYRTWLGFHTAATDISKKSCLQNNSSEVSCEQLKKALISRLKLWQKNTTEELRKPVASTINQLEPSSPLADQLASDFMSLVFEGSGIHFLQDNISSGHLRVVREAYNLEDSRFYHDHDSQHGLIAKVHSTEKTQTLVTFGDDYIFSQPKVATEQNCLNPVTKKDVSYCLLQKQRQVLLHSTTASLLDWANSGSSFTKIKNSKNKIDKMLFTSLPIHPTSLQGESTTNKKTKIDYSDLPQAQPDFSYQSLLFASAADPKLDYQSLGVRLQFLSGLGDEATWLTSYNFGFFTNHSDSYNQRSMEFAYMFHWRWSARFLLNMAPYIEIADESVPSFRRSKISVGPTIGITALPEGWIRLPLEITLLWKNPHQIFSSKDNITDPYKQIQYFEISFGLSIL